jgi:hypothetical protein
MMEKVTLNRRQMDQLVEFITNFKDVQQITLEEGHSSGIGPDVRVKCSLFGNDSKPETIIDITDVSCW